jgi:ketosteroid isomerase-like protein
MHAFLHCAALCVLLPGSAIAQAPADAPVPKLTADECAVWARELSFAQSVADHDAEAFAAHLQQDTAFGASRAEPTRGRDNVTRRWAGIIEGKDLRLAWYPSRVTIGGPGDVAWSSGPTLYEDLRDEAGAAGKTESRHAIGAYHSVWHKDPDGTWRVLFDDGVEPKPASEAEVAAFRAGRRSACPQG